MPLTLITGPANAGKTGEVFRELESATATRRSAALLLPTGPDVRRARHEVARRCPVGVEVAQIDRYLASRWALYGDGRRIVGGVARRTLMAQAVSRSGAESPSSSGVRRALEAVVRVSTGADLPRGALGEAGRVLAAYRELLLEADLIEAVDAQQLLSGREEDRADHLVAHRFTDLSEAQEHYLVSAAAGGSEVTVTLTWERGHPGTRALDGLVDRLRQAGGVHRPLTEDVRYYQSAGIETLSAKIFQPCIDASPPGGAVRLVEARGPEGETRAVVAQVRRLLGEGLEPEEIAIVHREPTRVLDRLIGVCSEAGLRLDADVPVPVRCTAFGRAFARLLAFVERGEANDLVGFVRTPYSGMQSEAADGLERSWRRRRTSGRGGLMAAVARVSPACVDLLRAAERAHGSNASVQGVRQWREALDLMLANGAAAMTMPDDYASGQDADVHVAVCEVLGDLEGVGASRAEDLRAALAESHVRPRAVERPGRVQLMGARRARSRRFAGVILFGMDGDTFPRPGGEGLAGDAVGALARRMGARASAESGQDGERLLFYQVVTRASRALVMIRQAFDESGQERRPSTFWHEVTNALGTTCVESHDPDASPASDHEKALRAARGSSSRSRPRRLVDSRTLQELGERDVFSVSELESYLNCPFRWFYQRVLRPTEMDTELTPREFGGLAHRVLELTYARLKDATGASRVSDGNLEKVLSLAEAALEEAATDLPSPGNLIELEGIRQVRARVRTLLQADADSYPGFENAHAEWAFGMGEEEPERFDGFSLRGKVDRIDRDGSRSIVMDYKWSAGSSFGRFTAEGLVQLPLYAEVVRRRLGGTVVAGLYRGLRSEKDRGFAVKGATEGPWLGPRAHDWIDAETLEELVSEATQRAAVAVNGIRSGRIPAEPLHAGACRYCAAGPVCGECVR